MKARLGLVIALFLTVALATGCVTTKKFETAMSDVTTRVDGVQTKVETQSGRIDKLEQSQGQLATDLQKTNGDVGQVRESSTAAMTRAQAAEKAARGKILWQVTLNNNDVRFGPDKFELADTGRQALDQLVDKLKSMDKMVFIEVQGHTDSRGGEQYNEVLGQRRAEMVRNYLHDHGIPLNLIAAISYGDKKPVADNKTREGRAENRRVEVLVLE
jgi:peptidoglycan-associated lipoprotein